MLACRAGASWGRRRPVINVREHQRERGGARRFCLRLFVRWCRAWGTRCAPQDAGPGGAGGDYCLASERAADVENMELGTGLVGPKHELQKSSGKVIPLGVFWKVPRPDQVRMRVSRLKDS